MGRRIAAEHLDQLVSHWRGLLGLSGASPFGVSVNIFITLCGHHPDALDRVSRRRFAAALRALAQAHGNDCSAGANRSGVQVDAWIRKNLVSPGALVTPARRRSLLAAQRDRSRRQRRETAGVKVLTVGLRPDAWTKLRQLVAHHQGGELVATLEALIREAHARIAPGPPIRARNRPVTPDGQGSLLD